ncbi:hypothetical protein JOY44_29575 (plasmid) [Phormidium sp. CLA17]|uniref:hypothetical protein n=1 Tax=Leptolyngbya sp. Cla-17 TaxID=2803751 RepID=UPI001491E334|nr:hypothetical protein [Leptolyngbya sp. Cla-17]MBM0745573.1 hypothetical protein [Leptolyngbya sp. Cla-17]
MKLPFRYRRRHQSTIVKAFLGVGLIGCAIASIPDTQRNLERLSQVRDRAAAISTEQELKKLDAEKVAAEAKTADMRLMKGCSTFLVSASNATKFGNVYPGGKVVNPTTDLSLAPGSIVCDNQGGTAVMADIGGSGIAMTDIAITQDFRLVRKAMDLHGINPQAGDGRIGGANARLQH